MNQINVETQQQISNVQKAYTALAQVITRYENTLAIKHENKEDADLKFGHAKRMLEVSMRFLIEGLCLLGEEK